LTIDHIIPLRGRTVEGYRVSGLHVLGNLQYLTKEANQAKSNRMRPEDQALCEAQAPFIVMSAHAPIPQPARLTGGHVGGGVGDLGPHPQANSGTPGNGCTA
jgi:hypothetical protein